MSFETMGLAPAVLTAILDKGFREPTPIQVQAIPRVLEGRDVIGSAQTGTGKTAAFALPLLTRLGGHRRGGPWVLVLEPTRELAAQVEQSFKELGARTGIRVGVMYGGVGYGAQNTMLRDGVDVLVACPGRLLDHLQQGNVSLGQVRHLVIDEADRMLDMGFLPDVRRIIERCPRDRQTCLFTATLPSDIQNLIKWAMRNPEVVDIGKRATPAATITHALYPVALHLKRNLLLALLDKANFEQVIVFCGSKHRADRVAKFLKGTDHKPCVLHSDRSQRQREQALQGFRDGDYDVLVATDIAARGIDVPQVSHVINYDLPRNPEDYVHRIGRTGRAQAAGDAFSLVTDEDRAYVRDIEKFIRQTLRQEKLEGFDYAAPAPEAPANRPPRPGRHHGDGQPLEGRSGHHHGEHRPGGAGGAPARRFGRRFRR